MIFKVTQVRQCKQVTKPHLETLSPRPGGWRSLSPNCMFANPKDILIKTRLNHSSSFVLYVMASFECLF